VYSLCRISNSRRDASSYLHYMQKAKVQTGLKIYEGTDVWKPLESWIKGGLEKIHMWHFSAAI
jgi:hypothetical protein